MQPGTFHGAYAGLHQVSAAYSQHCCDLMLHVVVIVPMPACVRRAQLLHSNAVARCHIQSHMQPGTSHCACVGLHLASVAGTQRCCGTLSRAVKLVVTDMKLCDSGYYFCRAPPIHQWVAAAPVTHSHRSSDRHYCRWMVRTSMTSLLLLVEKYNLFVLKL